MQSVPHVLGRRRTLIWQRFCSLECWNSFTVTALHLLVKKATNPTPSQGSESSRTSYDAMLLTDAERSDAYDQDADITFRMNQKGASGLTATRRCEMDAKRRDAYSPDAERRDAYSPDANTRTSGGGKGRHTLRHWQIDADKSFGM